VCKCVCVLCVCVFVCMCVRVPATVVDACTGISAALHTVGSFAALHTVLYILHTVLYTQYRNITIIMCVKPVCKAWNIAALHTVL